MTDDRPTLGLIGAGTMGAGIAHVAATHGWTVEMMDLDEAIVHRMIHGIGRRIERLVASGRLPPAASANLAKRLLPATDPACFSFCRLVIEAVVEDLETKVAALQPVIPALPTDAIIATNTSSLSVSRLGEALGQPQRTVGLHFFNPAPIMKLVEIVPGEQTDPAIVARATEIATSWEKVAVRAADVPGFIVNHVARPYYLEAFRILEDGLATPDLIDQTMRALGGFRMGPLELTDFIGQDVAAAASRSIWNRLDRPPLLTPSRMQEDLVEAGHLGRKTGRGVYDYTGDEPRPALAISPRALERTDTLRDAVNAFAERATDKPGTEQQNYIFARILAGLIVQAGLAQERGVAEPADIDQALMHGVNYPRGPFDWARQIGHDRVAALIEVLNESVRDQRFTVPRSLGGRV